MTQIALSEKQTEQFSLWVADYIAEQRAVFRRKAKPIPTDRKTKLLPFFPSDVLDHVLVTSGQAPEPSFYKQLHTLGITNAPPFSQMAGITFQDLIVHTESLSDRLLFHELVHAVQYKHLTLRGFAERYVRGFLSGGSYEEIPLEKQAYALEAKFAARPDDAFSVEADVEKRIRDGLI